MKLVCTLAQISTPNQIRSMPSFSATGASSGMTMNTISKKSRKNAITKMKMLTKIRKPICPPGSDDQQVLDPFLAADALKDQAEHARADQDEDHEGGDPHGGRHALPDQRPGQRAVEGGEREGADDAERASFGRSREAEEDGAKHEKDQRRPKE